SESYSLLAALGAPALRRLPNRFGLAPWFLTERLVHVRYFVEGGLASDCADLAIDYMRDFERVRPVQNCGLSLWRHEVQLHRFVGKALDNALISYFRLWIAAHLMEIEHFTMEGARIWQWRPQKAADVILNGVRGLVVNNDIGY